MDNLIKAAEMQSSRQAAQPIPYYRGESPPIPMPKNKSELEIYNLLERANLLEYFSTFLEHGGDDIVQLAEAEENEEEFLEYVKLFGMDRKPLHVRRFQKELVRWKEDRLNNPTVDSGANRYLFYCQTTRSETPQQQQYLAPHEIIKNVPKRPRLMDSIMPSDLTKGLVYDSSVNSTPVRSAHFKGRGLKLNSGNLSSESKPTTPTEERHLSQFSPPDSEELNSDESPSRAKSRSRTRRKAAPTKSRIN